MWGVDRSCVMVFVKRPSTGFMIVMKKIGYSSRSFLLLHFLLYLIGLNTGEIYIQCMKHLMEVKIEIGRVLQFNILVHG